MAQVAATRVRRGIDDAIALGTQGLADARAHDGGKVRVKRREGDMVMTVMQIWQWKLVAIAGGEEESGGSDGLHDDEALRWSSSEGVSGTG